jgi:hypothetical protein
LSVIHRQVANRRCTVALTTPVNEFYKKGCQEKTSASTGGLEDLCLENPTDHPQRDRRRWKPETLKLLADAIVWRRTPAPFFQIVKVIAAISRAKVRRATVDRIPFSRRAT